MITPSNLYVEKAFAEHPIAMWALDDKCDYYSQIDESYRSFYDYTNQWTYTGITPSPTNVRQFDVTENDLSSAVPLQETSATHITGDAPNPGETKEIVIRSKVSGPGRNFSIGLWVYTDANLQSITLGYGQDSENEETDEHTDVSKGRWFFISSTFNTILTPGVSANLVVKIKYSGSTHYNFYLNGLSCGINGEEFNKTSLGIRPTKLPDGIAKIHSSLSNNNDVDVLEAYAYGAQNTPAYYLANPENRILFARNSSIPMVFGASNSTVLSSAGPQIPSMIFPGFGFMNENGRSSSLTFESWIRINIQYAESPKRIFGPIGSDDGLYVDKTFLVLKIGDRVASHFVGEWYRPMLMQISISGDKVTMFINGVMVMSIDLDPSKTYFPPKLIENKDNDYLGFYIPSTNMQIELDAVAIYPYVMNSFLANRKFVLGQGVQYPEGILSAYRGSAVYADYSFANYSKNYSYPALGKWSQGVYDNAVISDSRIESPKYTLPKFLSNKNTLEDLLSHPLQNPISLMPSESFGNSYFLFESMNILVSPVAAIFGSFFIPSSDTYENEQVLFKIFNKINNSYLKAYRVRKDIDTVSVRCVFKQSGKSEVVLSESDIEKSPMGTTSFSFGVNIERAIQENYDLSVFFSNRDQMSIYLGGDYSGDEDDLSTTFTGRIENFSLLTSKDLNRFNPALGEKLKDHSFLFGAPPYWNRISSYTLKIKTIGSYKSLDISTKSYWENSVPLSFLSTNVLDSQGKSVSAIDAGKMLIQANMNYPAFVNIIRPYLAELKMFVSLQKISDGANADISEYSRVEFTDSEKKDIISISANETITQIFDGTIIEPATSDDYAIVLHMEMETEASIIEPINLKYLKLASKNLSDNSNSFDKPINAIGTRFGKNIYPYTVLSDGTVSYSDERNFYRIYDGNTPYLYLTNSSGFSSVQNIQDFSQEVDKGLFFRINRDSGARANISLLQFAILWNHEPFALRQLLFEIDSDQGTVRFYIQSANDGSLSKGKITAKLYDKSTNTEKDTDLPNFFVNGLDVYEPIIRQGEWAMLQIVFKPFLTFKNSTGLFKIRNRAILNNISYYQIDELLQSQQTTQRIWSKVEQPSTVPWDLGGVGVEYNWGSESTIDQLDVWYSPNDQYVGSPNSSTPGNDYTWQDIIYEKEDTKPAIPPNVVYGVFLGTNKIISNSNAESGLVRLHGYRYYTEGGVDNASVIVKPL